MKNTLGNHLLIDFYNCQASFACPEALHPLIEAAFSAVDLPLYSWQDYHCDGEFICSAITDHGHITIHYYDVLAYAAVDIYIFNSNRSLNRMMGALKRLFQSDRIKATAVRRGDFGVIRDMKPKKKTKLTTIRRVKTTGAKIRKTSVSMFHILCHPQRNQRRYKH